MDRNSNQPKVLIGSPKRNDFHDSRGLGKILFDNFVRHGKKTMQIDGITRKEETFEEVFLKCKRTALHMKQNGLKPQDKILICTYNSLDSIVPLISSFFLGVIPTAVDPSFIFQDFNNYLQKFKPKAIFVCPEAVESVSKSVENLNLNCKIVVFGCSKFFDCFDEYLKEIDGENSFEPFESVSGKETAIIVMTSGSTGAPKGTCLNHSYFVNFSLIPFFAENDRIMFLSSLYWVTQIGLTISNVLHGFTKIIYPKFDNALNFCEVIQKCQVQSVLLPTPYLVEVTDYCRKNNITLNLKNILMAGTPISNKNLVNAIETFPETKFQNCYGQTEIGAITAFPWKESYTCQMEEKLLKGSCGQVVLGTRIKIVDLESRKLLGPNKQGEICVQSPYMLNDYYRTNDPEIYDDENWIRTGDIGFYDEDDYLYITGRCKEMLKYRTFPVSPTTLEGILSEYPSVKLSVVAGIPDEIDGDLPIAFVVLKENCQANPIEIQKFVDDRVSNYEKLRGGVKIIDSIPLTSTGKPNRKLLKEMLYEGKF